MPGSSSLPFHLSSLPGVNASIFGANDMPFPPGGWMLMCSVPPTLLSPEMPVIKGFHSGWRSKSVSTCHTFAAGAEIYIVVSICFITLDSTGYKWWYATGYHNGIIFLIHRSAARGPILRRVCPDNKIPRCESTRLCSRAARPFP